MEINPNRSLNRIQHAKPKGKSAKSAAAREAEASPNGPSAAVSVGTLEDELNELPEIRAEKIREGEILARDPHYPDREELGDVGRLLMESVLRDSLSER